MPLTRFPECLKQPIIRAFQCEKEHLKVTVRGPCSWSLWASLSLLGHCLLPCGRALPYSEQSLFPEEKTEVLQFLVSQEVTGRTITLFYKIKKQSFSNRILPHFLECRKARVIRTSSPVASQEEREREKVILENFITNAKLVACLPPFFLTQRTLNLFR